MTEGLSIDEIDRLLPPLQVPAGTGGDPPVQPVRPGGLPRHLAERAVEPAITGQRSEQTCALVVAGLEWGLSDGEILSLALAHAPTVEKYGTRAEPEVLRLLAKYRGQHQHVGSPCDVAGCPSCPSWMTGDSASWNSGAKRSSRSSAPDDIGKEAELLFDPTLLDYIAAEFGLDRASAELLAPTIAQRVAFERTTGIARRFVRDEQLERDIDFAGIDVVSAVDLLQRERPERPRVFGDLVLQGHNVTLIAPWKVGKSTLAENMVRAASTGDNFLGRFPVSSPMRVTYMNYELDEQDMDARIRRLCLPAEAGERVHVVNLRGQRLPIMTPSGRRWLRNVLADHGTELWIIDPFGAAYAAAGGESENDNAEVRRFLTALDEAKRTAGVGTLVMPVHTGRAVSDEGEERGRGATVIDDWPDVQMFLTKGKDEQRFLRTDGRAPYKLFESRLAFDEAEGHLSLLSGDLGVTRTQARKQSRMISVVDLVAAHPGMNKRTLLAALHDAGVKNTDEKTALVELVLGEALIHCHKDGQSLLHYAGPSHPGAPCAAGGPEDAM